ncbi:fimbrillin family protein [uncultured Barnesiella sp.]|uniref:fimbrillin family protein n=1 Tax=uncultured Barnesiella sp. TaxID=584861 RepID=UPI00260B080D|nr:fimbrillin family protein [uncultured Barnesiella sp.]
MKRTTIHISAALALLLALAACTQDEAGFLPEGAEGTPIVFTATGLNPAATATAGTRAPVDGNWEGVQSVAVLMGGTVKAYDVTPSTADNTGATLTSTDPHYWTNHDDITVTAWWPYTEGETTPPAVVVRADQSSPTDFEGSDFISAENQPVSYGNPTLRFTHRTARVTVILTDYTEEQMFVRLTGLSTENGNPAVIAPYDKGGDTYTALVAPQSVAAGTAFITCAFNNGKTFAYRMQGAAEWKAGEEYTYTVSLAAAKDPGYTIEGDGSYTVTTADGLKNVAKLVNEEGKTDINITLDTDLTLTGEWTPIGSYINYTYTGYTGTFDGQGHTIFGLTINQVRDAVGLIGCIDKGGIVKNVKLKDVNITGDGYFVGGVAGTNYGTIENCSVDGTLTNNRHYLGGVVGNNYGSIIGCSSSGTITGTSPNVGGIGGQSVGGTIMACYSVANIKGRSSSGGVLGQTNRETVVIACYHAKGNVTGEQSRMIGGVIGWNYGKVTACYWENNQGQGIGDNQGSTTIETTKVDGTDVTWQKAVAAMNTALQSAGSEWRYELTGALPTLKKEQ